MRENEFEFIRGLVYEHSRINLSADKRELVSARLSKRLRATKLSSIGDYCRLLKSADDDGELSHLIDAISTNHTFFFREIAHFDFLAKVGLPEFRSPVHGKNRPQLRIWSAACSSGEEPYSIAMTLAENMDVTWSWHIDATDISNRILATASAGIYRDETVRKMDPQRISRHFQRGHGPQTGNHRVKAALRSKISFRRLNLLEGSLPFNHHFHVVFCRNVMIYFDRPTQVELVQKITRHLVPGGYLFVGHSESLTGIPHSLQTIQPAIYRRPLNS